MTDLACWHLPTQPRPLCGDGEECARTLSLIIGGFIVKTETILQANSERKSAFFVGALPEAFYSALSGKKTRSIAPGAGTTRRSGSPRRNCFLESSTVPSNFPSQKLQYHGIRKPSELTTHFESETYEN
jgi:hypothetical protein